MVNASTVDLNGFLKREFQVICETVVRLVEIGKKKARRHDTHIMSVSYLFSLLHEDVPAGLREMGTEQVWEGSTGWVCGRTVLVED